jgi:hypothetical protein
VKVNLKLRLEHLVDAWIPENLPLKGGRDPSSRTFTGPSNLLIPPPETKMSTLGRSWNIADLAERRG